MSPGIDELSSSQAEPHDGLCYRKKIRIESLTPISWRKKRNGTAKRIFRIWIDNYSYGPCNFNINQCDQAKSVAGIEVTEFGCEGTGNLIFAQLNRGNSRNFLKAEANS